MTDGGAKTIIAVKAIINRPRDAVWRICPLVPMDATSTLLVAQVTSWVRARS